MNQFYCDLHTLQGRLLTGPLHPPDNHIGDRDPGDLMIEEDSMFEADKGQDADQDGLVELAEFTLVPRQYCRTIPCLVNGLSHKEIRTRLNLSAQVPDLVFRVWGTEI